MFTNIVLGLLLTWIAVYNFFYPDKNRREDSKITVTNFGRPVCLNGEHTIERVGYKVLQPPKVDRDGVVAELGTSFRDECTKCNYKGDYSDVISTRPIKEIDIGPEDYETFTDPKFLLIVDDDTDLIVDDLEEEKKDE